MQGVWDCDEAQGVGERHVKMMPRAPHYEVGCLGSDEGQGYWISLRLY